VQGYPAAEALAVGTLTALVDDIAIQTVSVVGAVLILAGYALASRPAWSPETRRSALVNLGGAVLLCAVALLERQVGFVVLEGAWTLIALRRLVQPRANS
jgi:hypothetical protein